MGGFGFTEEQEMFRKEVTRFAQKELAPGAVKSEWYKHLVNDPEKAVDMFRWFIGQRGRRAFRDCLLRLIPGVR